MKLVTPSFEFELSPLRAADDEDWCRVCVQARSNGIHASFEAWLQTANVLHFASEVGAMNARVGQPGTATLSCAEGEIFLQLSMRTLGGITGRFKLRPEPQGEGAVEFSGSFELDQSYLLGINEGALVLASQLRGESAA